MLSALKMLIQQRRKNAFFLFCFTAFVALLYIYQARLHARPRARLGLETNYNFDHNFATVNCQNKQAVVTFRGKSPPRKTSIYSSFDSTAPGCPVFEHSGDVAVTSKQWYHAVFRLLLGTPLLSKHQRVLVVVDCVHNPFYTALRTILKSSQLTLISANDMLECKSEGKYTAALVLTLYLHIKNRERLAEISARVSKALVKSSTITLLSIPDTAVIADLKQADRKMHARICNSGFCQGSIAVPKFMLKTWKTSAHVQKQAFIFEDRLMMDTRIYYSPTRITSTVVLAPRRVTQTSECSKSIRADDVTVLPMQLFDNPNSAWEVVSRIKLVCPSVHIVIGFPSPQEGEFMDFNFCKDEFNKISCQPILGKQTIGNSVKQLLKIAEKISTFVLMIPPGMHLSESFSMDRLVLALEDGVTNIKPTTESITKLNEFLRSTSHVDVIGSQFVHTVPRVLGHGCFSLSIRHWSLRAKENDYSGSLENAYLCDAILSVFMARASTLNAFGWVHTMEVGVLGDWFLRAKHAGFKVALFANSFVESEMRPMSYMEFEKSMMVRSWKPTTMEEAWITFGEWHDVRAIEDSSGLNYLLNCVHTKYWEDSMCHRLYWWENGFTSPPDVLYHVNRILVELIHIFDSTGISYILGGGNHCAAFRDKALVIPFDTDGDIYVDVATNMTTLEELLQGRMGKLGVKVKLMKYAYFKLSHNGWNTVDIIRGYKPTFETAQVIVDDELVNVRTDHITCIPGYNELPRNRDAAITQCPRKEGYTELFKRESKWILTYGNKSIHHACGTFPIDEMEDIKSVDRKYSLW